MPFYGYARLFFLAYLVAPQTQGARVIYQQYVHPFLQKNESQIDEFIAASVQQLKSAGFSYLSQAIDYVRENFLGMPPPPPEPPVPANAGAQGYTQALLAKFSIPTAGWAAGAPGGGDIYSLLSSAVAAASGSGATRGAPDSDMTASGTLIPENLRDSGEKMSFIATQKERLNYLLAALDREAQQIQTETPRQVPPGAFDGAAADSGATLRSPPSGLSLLSALSKSKSEADFEKIEADSGAEDDLTMRRRHVPSGSGSWMSPWGWGAGGAGGAGDGDGQGEDRGASSARDK